MGMEGNDTLSVNSKYHFPMQSVFKFPIALTVLHFVDQKKLTLSQKMELTKEELSQNTYSPIKEKFPDGVSLKLSDLIRYSASQSDNIATDDLLRLIGGVKSVENFIKNSGISDIAIEYNEVE